MQMYKSNTSLFSHKCLKQAMFQSCLDTTLVLLYLCIYIALKLYKLIKHTYFDSGKRYSGYIECMWRSLHGK